MNEMELFKRLVEIRDEADDQGRYRIKGMVNELILDRWGAQDGPAVCGDFEIDGTCIHSDCMRAAGM